MHYGLVNSIRLKVNIVSFLKVVTTDGDEMVFTVKVTTEASKEQMIKDVDVGGTTLILETGKKTIEALQVDFSCRVQIITEVNYNYINYSKIRNY